MEKRAKERTLMSYTPDIKATYKKDMIAAEEFIVKKGKKSFRKIVVE